MRLITAIFMLLGTLSMSAQQLPMDPMVRHGKLDNGLTYYICPNAQPRQEAEFYLVQRVGSILEEEHQRGLAHFLEHMAFNGTKHFPDKRLIDYLEENGVKFGTDINAYTSFDHTVYSISNVPTLRTGLVDSCLLILNDWSAHITLDDKEIDAERQVIHEEWRSKRSARDRIYEQTLPRLFPDNNRYANRMPIGLMEVVDNFPYQALRDYYRRWYRPDLQAVIVVGDVDASYVESRIRELWRDVKVPSGAPKRVYYTVPNNASPIVAIGTDPELSSGTLRISFKYDPLPTEANLTLEGQRDVFCRALVMSMLSARIADYQQSGMLPSGANVRFSDGDYSLAMTKKALSASVGFQGDNWQGGMQMLVYMLNQALAHGFSAEEYERVSAQILMSLRQMEAQSGAKLPSNFLVQRCLDHFLHANPLLTMQQTAELNRQLLAEMTLDKVNSRFAEYLYSPGGVAILLQGRAQEGHKWPTEEEVVEVYIQSWNIPTQPHEIPQMEPTPELMPTKPQPGTIVKTKQNKRYGTTELTLSNGARVILKPTQSDAVRLTATSNGGTSLISDSEYANINAINALPSMGGLGELSGRDLGRALEGRNVSYKVNVGTLAETFSGGCDKADTEQLLQLLHLRFTTVRKDYAAFERWQQNTRSTVMQQQASPMTHFADTLHSTMYEPHPRKRKASMDLADSVDYDRTCQLFHDRFANAADFTFIFVGDIDAEALSPLICTYIASLPGDAKQREKADLTALPRMRRGKHVTHVQIPMENPVTTVIYNIAAKQRYTARSNAACAILSEVMNSLCTETLREQEGGTYNVSVTSRISRQPADELTLMFNFSTNPQQAAPLLSRAIELLRQVADEEPSTEAFSKAREYLLKQHHDYKGSDAYWMASLTDRVRYADDITFSTGEALQKITPKDVRRLARKLIRSRNTAEVIMNGAE